MIIPLDVEFDLQEALDYYEIIKSKYDHLKWTLKDDVVDYQKHKVNGVYGWGIQSNLRDLNVPCPPYDIHKEKINEYRDTELMFGFAKKIKDFFPEVRQLGLAAHPHGVEIAQHVDNDEFFKIHVPLLSNSEAYFIFGNIKHVMEPGKMYLVETKEMHGTANLGKTDRVHLLFKCPRTRLLEVQELKGKL